MSQNVPTSALLHLSNMIPKWIKRQWMWLTHFKVDRNSDFFKVLNEFKKNNPEPK